MHKRIAAARKARGWTQAQLAEAIGLSRNYVWMIENGDRTPPDRTIADICRVLGVNEIWLRTGEGEMLRQLSEDEELKLIFDQIHMSTDPTIRAIIRAYWKLPDNAKAAVRQLIMDADAQIKKGASDKSCGIHMNRQM